MLDYHVITMGSVALVLLLMGVEDFLTKHVKTRRSYFYEGIIIVCVVANFIMNWMLAVLLAIVGVCMYFVAIPGTAKILERYKFHFELLDKEVFGVTLIGFPFISMIAFVVNQIAFALRSFLGRIYPKIEQYSAALFIYGMVWFCIACFIIAVYIR